MTSTTEQGRKSENTAQAYLENQGMQCVARNFRCRTGEIDLICLTSDQTLVFVEVRLRRPGNYASAAESISIPKQQRIIQCSQYFLHCHPHYQHCNLRFDVVLFDHQDQSPFWICSAFDASSAY